MAVRFTIHNALESIAHWYGGGTEGNRSDLDIIIDVVSDLQKDRAEVLTQKEQIEKLKFRLEQWKNKAIRYKCDLDDLKARKDK